MGIRMYDPVTNRIISLYCGKRPAHLRGPRSGLKRGFSPHCLRTRETLVINENMQEAIEKLRQLHHPRTQTGEIRHLGPARRGRPGARCDRLAELCNARTPSANSDVRLLQTLANSMSVALENARLFDETQRLLKETEQRAAELAVINSIQAGPGGRARLPGHHRPGRRQAARDLQHRRHRYPLVRPEDQPGALPCTTTNTACGCMAPAPTARA